MNRILLLFLSLTTAVLAAPVFISGRVTDAETGNGLPDVIVSNSSESVRTDKNGQYKLERHANTRFVTVTVPADRETECFYRRVDQADSRTADCDFTLHRRPKYESFRFIHVGDTETEGQDELAKTCFDGIRSFAHNCGAAFMVHTGDIHTPSDQLLHKNYFSTRNFGRPVHHTCGNHDYKTPERGEKCFEDTLGPLFYSFEEGNVLFIVIPTLTSYDKKPSIVPEDISRFIHNLLAIVPKDKPIIFFSHYNEQLSPEGFTGEGTPFRTDLKQWNLKGWVFGHTHLNRVRELPCGIRLFNTTITLKGGGFMDPTSFRYFHVAPDGTLTSQIVPTFADKFMDVRVSPAGTDGRHAIAATVMDSSSHVMSIEADILSAGVSERIALPKVNGILWAAKYPFQSGKTYRIRLYAHLNSGDTLIREEVFPQPTVASKHLELERMVTLPGQSHAARPAYGNGCFYVPLCDNDNGRLNGICAIDAMTGRRLWTARTLAGVRVNPFYSNGRIYVGDDDSNLYAFNAADGSPIWQSIAERTDSRQIFTGGLLLADNVLYGGNRPNLRAVDAASGKVIWRDGSIPKLSEVCLSSAPFMSAGNIVFPSGPFIHARALKASDGTPVWEAPKSEYSERTTITQLTDGKLLCTSRYNSMILDCATGRLLQQNDVKETGNIRSRTGSLPLVHDGTVYLGTAANGIAAFDLKTMKRLWCTTETAGAPATGTVLTARYYRMKSPCVDASPILLGNDIVFIGLDGMLYECSATDGKLTGKLAIGAPVIASPALSDDRICVVDLSGRCFIFKVRRP